MKEILSNVQGLPLIFPIHQRIEKIFNDLGINEPNLKPTAPLGYPEFNYLVERAKVCQQIPEVSQRKQLLWACPVLHYVITPKDLRL